MTITYTSVFGSKRPTFGARSPGAIPKSGKRMTSSCSSPGATLITSSKSTRSTRFMKPSGSGKTFTSQAGVITGGRSSMPRAHASWCSMAWAATCIRGASVGDFSIGISDRKDIHQPGGRYYGRPEFDAACARIMVLDGVGGHVHPRGERWGFLDWDFPGLKTAVHVDGVVNSRTNTDRGWTVELAFPWKGLELIADGRSLPPADGDVWRIDCSRFEKIGRHRQVL